MVIYNLIDNNGNFTRGNEKMINIGLLGLGTVGTGVLKILEKRKEELIKITGDDINIKKILVRDLAKKRDIELEGGIITDNFDEILKDEDITIIVEVTGDLEEGYKYVSESLRAGKHVVTANKALVSKYFEELSDLAHKKKLALLYEASVGGGIPVIKPLKELIPFNDIKEVRGILNGTCNYILTRMEEGLDYAEALKIAQEQGFAEADPTDDVEGLDTRRKLRILGTLALQGQMPEENIIVRGISNITAFDISNINKMGASVKLIGEVKSCEGGYTAIVEPVIVESSSPFYNVGYEENAVFVKGDNVGDLMFYGNGAGMLPTANAVLCDLMDIIAGSYRLNNPLGNKKLMDLSLAIKGSYYLRISKINGELMDVFKSLADKVLSTGAQFALVTKHILRKDLIDLLENLGIEEKDYFIAKFDKINT